MGAGSTLLILTCIGIIGYMFCFYFCPEIFQQIPDDINDILNPPTVTVSPKTIQQTQVLTVSLVHYPENAGVRGTTTHYENGVKYVEIWFTGTTDSQGRFTTSFHVYLDPGTYTFVAASLDGKTQASTTFTVTQI